MAAVTTSILRGSGSILLSSHCHRTAAAAVTGNRIFNFNPPLIISAISPSISIHSISTVPHIYSPITNLSSRTSRSTPRFCTTGVEATTTAATPTTDSPEPVKELAKLLDLRVGKVLKAWRHPEADSLYVEEVDIGEPEPRTICSGLVNYVALEVLQDKLVVVLANLKPRNMRGVKSCGMLMAASDAGHENVELIVPPEGSVPGERIWFGGGVGEEGGEGSGVMTPAATPNQVQKKKIWESVQPHLKTDDSCVVVLDGEHRMMTSVGAVVSSSLKNANVS